MTVNGDGFIIGSDFPLEATQHGVVLKQVSVSMGVRSIVDGDNV
jgi:hypothetical protein